MEILYAWKTIKADCFKREVLFTYAEKTSENLDDWNSVHEDLLINITIHPCDPAPIEEDYFFLGETYAMIFSWKGDSRFSGSTSFLDYRFDTPWQITYLIPKGTCGSKLQAECFLVIKDAAETEGGEWYRPPGSIIGVIPIIEKITIDKGEWFPVEEFEGNGNTLLHWEFVNMENLDLSVSSCFLILVDKKHPTATLLGSGPEGQALLSLMVVQGIVRKALTDEVYEQLKLKQETGEDWMTGSAGACFDFVLKKMISVTSLTSFDALRTVYLDSPERIDEVVDQVFSAGFILSFKK